MKTIVAILCAAALLSSCATRYQPIGAGNSGGHSFQRHSGDVFSVKFHANRYTSSKRASDFALLRALELCHAHHFSYFTILGAEDGTTHYTPNGTPARGPVAQISIRCFTRPPTDQSGRVYTAASVAAELRAMYGIQSGRCA